MSDPRASPPPAYRAEIDGLRAVAVLGVVAFHAAPASLRAGFVGVDVFFVISGYLITRLLLDRHAAGQFSFADFYAARIRRIAPALVVMLAGVTALSLALLPPSDLSALARTVMATGGFVANWLFLSRTGYFDQPAEENPLLHVWSLSVEEQFYLLAPMALALVLLTPLRRWTPWLILAGACGSLALSEWYMLTGAEGAAFFLLRARAWELLLGGLLAAARRPGPRAAWVADGMAGAGLLAIVAAMALLDPARFPGLAALAPCIGTALVIHGTAGGKGRVRALLSMPVLVGVGLISYSLYLWHWPLLTLPRLVLSRPLEPAESAAALALAFGLAWLSWRFVERPFRYRREPAARLRALVAGPVALVGLIGAGAALAWSDGLPGRASPIVLAAEAAAGPSPTLGPTCHLESGDRPGAATDCSTGTGSAGVLLWGDSHARHLMPAVVAAARERGLIVRQATRSACPPLVAAVTNAECDRFNHAVVDQIHHQTRHVVLGGRWAGPADRLEADLRRTVRRIRAQAGDEVRITVVGPAPEFDFAPSFCHARRAFAGLGTGRCDRAPLADGAAAAAVQRVLDDVAATESGVAAVQLLPLFCMDGWCRARQDGVFYFRDDNHLTRQGAALLTPLFRGAFSASGDGDRPWVVANGSQATGATLDPARR